MAGSRDDAGASYVDPVHGVLKNRLGITDQRALDRAEADFSTLALREIAEGKGPPRTFDRAHLKALHQHIFQDVYEWAGHMRDERPMIDGERAGRIETLSKGHSTFLPARFIERGLDEAFAHVADKEALRTGTIDEFGERAARLLSDLNNVHPFREGNGRTQRAVIEELGRETGHEVDFRGITRARMIEASIEALHNPDSGSIRHVMRDATDPARRDALIQAGEILERAGFNADDRYIRTARPNERITGRAVFADAKAVHVVAGQELVIASRNDSNWQPGGERDVSFKAGRDFGGGAGRAAVRGENPLSSTQKRQQGWDEGRD